MSGCKFTICQEGEEKIMRKKIIILLVCSFLLCGCGREDSVNQGEVVAGNSNKKSAAVGAVGEERIASDIQESLSTYHQSVFGYPLKIREYTVQKSLTEDRTFTAQLEVLAESVYADFQYTADIQYTDYDQGWAMDGCTWELNKYYAVKYPDESAMEQIKDESNVSQQEEISLSFENGEIFYQGADVIDWSPMAHCSKAVAIEWCYNPYGDWWMEKHRSSGIDSEKCTLSSVLEGVWSLGQGDTATISNVSDSGFDLEINAAHYETDKFHVEVGNIFISDEGDSVQISFTSDQFNFRDPKYPSDFYGDMYGTAPFSMYLYKEKQERLGQIYNMCINFIVINNAGLGADVYGSDLYYLAE